MKRARRTVIGSGDHVLAPGTAIPLVGQADLTVVVIEMGTAVLDGRQLSAGDVLILDRDESIRLESSGERVAYSEVGVDLQIPRATAAPGELRIRATGCFRGKCGTSSSQRSYATGSEAASAA